MRHIIGWQRVRVSLAAFFAVLERRTDDLTPFNIFFSGKPGTGKTEGAVLLAKILGKTVAVIDSSTLDDIAELAGVVDIHANRTLGKNQLILGDLLQAEILVLDEFLNTRPHVMSQFRLMLQGKLTICGNVVALKTKAIIGTSNLSSDMLVGVANEVDSPTADRWSVIVEVPALEDMSSAEIDAIIDDEPFGDFEGVFLRTLAAMADNYNSTAAVFGKAVTLYVRTMLGHFASGSPFGFQGRRAKQLKQFILSAIALCQSEAELDVDEIVWQIVRDCLSYHRLSGLQLEFDKLESAHKLSMAVMHESLHNKAEAYIASESEVAVKVGLVIEHHAEVSAVTKAEVFSEVAASSDLALLTACRIVAQSPWGCGQPSGIVDVLKTGIRPSAEFFAGLAGLTPELAGGWLEVEPAQRLAHWIDWVNGSYTPETNKLMAQVRRYLQSWRVGPWASETAAGEQYGNADRAAFAAGNT
jgi:hypothetical protein